MDYLKELKHLLKTDYNLDYNSDKADNAYHKKAYDFFSYPETKENIDAAIKLLCKKKKFILIDGENIYHDSFTGSPSDKVRLADLYELYLRKYNIIIFCQKHSLDNVNERNNTDGRIKNLKGHIKDDKLYDKLYIFSGNKEYEKELLSKVTSINKLPDADEVSILIPEVPNKSEVDDLLLIYVAKKLIERRKKNIYIVSRDKYNWLSESLKTKINNIRVESIGDKKIRIHNKTRKKSKDDNLRKGDQKKTKARSRSRSKNSSGSTSNSTSSSSSSSNSNSASSASGKTKKNQIQKKIKLK